ncbi:hypothetical protein MNBD_IGNAVI01-1845 [hydrothermal vent metagenome]|uniref:Heavy metal binding domain-containing protein n=1 Tax=hydrothermal vent metagenome TaxID=652676 RepID=A0A3B1C1P7_9ZZZZ
MKKVINSFFALALLVVLSTTIFAQKKPAQKHSDKAMMQDVKHVCTAECKTKGHDYVKAKEAKAAMEANAAAVEHVCTEECKTKGHDYVKAKEARAALDKNQDGFIYECPMKCEATDEAGECSKCGMELKKTSVKES